MDFNLINVISTVAAMNPGAPPGAKSSEESGLFGLELDAKFPGLGVDETGEVNAEWPTATAEMLDILAQSLVPSLQPKQELPNPGESLALRIASPKQIEANLRAIGEVILSPARQELQSWLFGTQEKQSAPKVEIGPFSLDIPALSQSIAGKLFGEQNAFATKPNQDANPDSANHSSPILEFQQSGSISNGSRLITKEDGGIFEIRGEVIPDLYADYSFDEDSSLGELIPLGAPNSKNAPKTDAESIIKEILTDVFTFTGEPSQLTSQWDATLHNLDINAGNATDHPVTQNLSPHPNSFTVPNQLGQEDVNPHPQNVGRQVTNTSQQSEVRIDLPQTLQAMLTTVTRNAPQQEMVITKATDQLLARGPEAATTAQVIAAVEEFAKGKPEPTSLEVNSVEEESPVTIGKTVVTKAAANANKNHLADQPSDERTLDYESDDSNVLLKRGDTGVIQPKTADLTGPEVKTEAKVETSVRTGLAEAAERVTDFIRARRPGSVTVSLNPEDLGSITVKVAIQGQKIDLDVNATDDRVRHAMSAHRGEFIQQLDTKGMSLGEFRMGSEAQSQTNQQAQHQDQPEAQRKDFQRAVNLRLSQEAATNRPVATSSLGGRSMGIDTKA